MSCSAILINLFAFFVFASSTVVAVDNVNLRCLTHGPERIGVFADGRLWAMAAIMLAEWLIRGACAAAGFELHEDAHALSSATADAWAYSITATEVVRQKVLSLRR